MFRSAAPPIGAAYFDGFMVKWSYMKKGFKYKILDDDLFGVEDISICLETARVLIDRDFDLARNYIMLLIRDVFVKALELSDYNIDYDKVNDCDYLRDGINTHFVIRNLVFKDSSSSEAYISSDLYIDSFDQNINAIAKAASEYKEVPDSEKSAFLEMMVNIAGSICFSIYTSIVISRQNQKSEA